MYNNRHKETKFKPIKKRGKHIMKYLHISYWLPRKLKCNERIYNTYCDISEKDETIEELARLGYSYEIEIIENEE